ncbi:MAG: gamma-glutamyltransferase [Candidatus Omnitrophica bacterium]|nr:gamma-glutamyltransferase [Candidatus Omnitrophota bacterium]
MIRKYWISIFVGAFLFYIAPYRADAYTPVYAEQGMVAGPEPLAVQIGVDILKKGGNAFDAAAAVGFALAVTYPSAGNLGGGGFMTAVKDTQEPLFLDFRETAPLAASSDMYLDKDGNIIPGLSTSSLLAVGVPGTVHGLLTMFSDHGAMNRSDILDPAIQLAESGFHVSYSLHASLQANQDRLSAYPSTKRIFFSHESAPHFNSILRQPDLAWTLKKLRDEGAQAFYEGEVAEKLVNYMKNNGGIITREDLTAYRSKYRTPILFDYKDNTIVAPNLPSSGGITLAQILKLIEPHPMREIGRNSAEYIHILTEAERLAFADRNYFLGDRDFIRAPVDRLMSGDYLDARREQIPKYKAGSSERISHGRIESEETTHFCIVDRNRNAVAITYTLNESYGMKAVVEGAGFFLNNEMDDFNAKPGYPNVYGLVEGDANAIQPEKRMLSSMTPVIVLKDGKFAFTVGTPGGPTIITTAAQIIVNMLDFGMNIRDAIDAPRFHHQGLPDFIRFEREAFSYDTLKLLVGMGYTLKESGPIGFAAGIQQMDNHLLAGYADGRGEGSAAGY